MLQFASYFPVFFIQVYRHFDFLERIYYCKKQTDAIFLFFCPFIDD